MNQISASVFPDTLPDPELMFPLVQVFDRLVYLQAVEDEPPAAHAPLIEQLGRQGRLRLVAPVPLGDQRQRFLALVHDLRQRGADYISQLSMLTLAGIHQPERAESKQAIVSNLLGSAEISARKEEEMLLWQARLVLKLAEIHAIEQAELDEALARIALRQDELLAELREEADELFALTESLTHSGHRAEALLSHRLKAWSRLAFHDAALRWPQVLVTGYEAALATVSETYEKRQRREPVRLGRLLLPRAGAQISDSVWTAPLLPAVPYLTEAFAALARPEDLHQAEIDHTAALFGQGAAQWAEAVKQRFPAEQYGRCWLELHYFPGTTDRRLFLEGFAGGDGAAGRTKDDKGRGITVGLLAEA